MKGLWSTERRNPNIHWRTWKNWKSVIHQRNLCPLAWAKWGMIPKLTLSSVKENGVVLRGRGDLLFPGSVVRCFWVRNLMTGRLPVAIELGIGKKCPDTKTDFHRSLLQKPGLSARKLCMGGSVGKVSTEKGNTGPGLLPSQRARNGSNSMTQVMKDSLLGRPGIVYLHTNGCI